MKLKICTFLALGALAVAGANAAVTNLLTNPTFANDAEGWTRQGPGSFTNNGDGTVTLVGDGGDDNLLIQPVSLDAGVTYFYMVDYTSEGSGLTFTGMWNYVDNTAKWAGGLPYSDVPAAAEYKTYSVKYTAGANDSKCVILAVNKGGNTATYKAPLLMEQPYLKVMLANGVSAAAGDVTLNSVLTVEADSDVEVYVVKNGESTLCAGTFTVTELGEYTVNAVYKNVVVNTVKVNVVRTTTNKVAGWNNNGTPQDGDNTPADFGWVYTNADGTVCENNIGAFGVTGTTRFTNGNNGRDGVLFTHFQLSGFKYAAYPISGLEANKNYLVSVEYVRNDASNDNQSFLLGLNTKADNSGKSYYSKKHYTGNNKVWAKAQFVFKTGATLEDTYYVTFEKDVLNHLPITNFTVYEYDYADLSEATPIDYTTRINNHTFGSITNDGWTVEHSSWNYYPTEGGDKIAGSDDNRCIEFWDGAAGKANKVYQNVTLEKGVYVLTALAKNNNGAEGVYVYAGDQDSEPVSGAGSDYSVQFEVMSDNTSVEIGFRTEEGCSGNWQAVDNFRLALVGFPVISDEQVKAAYDAKLAEVKAYIAGIVEDAAAEDAFMATEEGAALMALVESEEVPTDYEAALSELNDAYGAFKNNYADYKVYFDARQYAGTLLDASEEAWGGIREFATTFSGIKMSEVKAKTDAVKLPLRAAALSHIVAEGCDNVVDYTGEIENAYGAATADGWNCEGNKYQNRSNEHWYDAEDVRPVLNYFDTGHWDDNAWNFNQNQTVYVAPGRYRVSVFARGSNDIDEYKFFANEEETDITRIGNSGGYFGGGWNAYWLDVEVVTSEAVPAAQADDAEVTAPLNLGVKIVSTKVHQWASFCNFQLVQLENYLKETGVKGISADTDAAEYYNLQGVRIAKPETGLYIVRKGGKALKVVK